jgi:membrane-bound lytic murein transglycosylase D
MKLTNSVVCWIALFFSFVLSTAMLAQDADLEEPVDTLDTWTAKGGGGMPTDAEIMERLSTLSGCVEYRSTGVVRGYIKTYVQVKTEKARTMLGKRLTYFPLFEQKLKEHGLPDDLKYLSVVESALNATAVSRVGATGLWQFMPSTGSEYGLRSNSAVEDRSNPVKSTDAAMRYLKELYRQFDDWALALAAYNSGPTRVNSAIKRAGSRNFWNIMRFLPQETRNYVPAFIAATYICNYFPVHGIRPYDPDLDEQMTNFINVYEGISFRDIADATGVSYTTIKTLNPGFKRDYVPPTTEGHFIILPQRVMPAFVRYLNQISSRGYNLENSEYFVNSTMGDGRYWQSVTVPKQAENINQFAQKFGLCGEHLKAWNKLNSNTVQPGQELIIYHPVYVQKHSSGRISAPEQPKAKPGKTESGPKVKKQFQESPQAPSPTPQIPVVEEPKVIQYQYHTVRRNESLEDIARQYATSIESLRKLNQIDSMKFGMRLKIRQF